MRGRSGGVGTCPVPRRTRPGKMLPEIAAHAISTYTRPGDLVIDPMCGIGTTLVEAVHAGRNAFGVEYEQQWVDVARANLALAVDQGATGHATLACADARTLPATAPLDLLGQAALVVTSPPYGRSVHGQARSSRDTGRPGVTKFHHSYGDRRDPANLANAHLDALLEGSPASSAARHSCSDPAARS
ncbi:MAG TPA: DNA methyltransferase [Mycobacterium sp.]|nr:DNA methyltransferase [Mycobacterium sp.]